MRRNPHSGLGSRGDRPRCEDRHGRSMIDELNAACLSTQTHRVTPNAPSVYWTSGLSCQRTRALRALHTRRAPRPAGPAASVPVLVFVPRPLPAALVSPVRRPSRLPAESAIARPPPCAAFAARSPSLADPATGRWACLRDMDLEWDSAPNRTHVSWQNGLGRPLISDMQILVGRSRGSLLPVRRSDGRAPDRCVPLSGSARCLVGSSTAADPTAAGRMVAGPSAAGPRVAAVRVAAPSAAARTRSCACRPRRPT
jgi:hypothetical protein